MSFRIFLLIIVSIGTLVEQTSAQEAKGRGSDQLYQLEAKNFASSRTRSIENTTGDSRFDVTYYMLDLRVSPQSQYLWGSVRMDARAVTAGVNAIYLDFGAGMNVDSVTSGGHNVGFLHSGDTLYISLDRMYAAGELFSTKVFYQGAPTEGSGFGDFTFNQHGTPAQPYIYTLSEPYGARNWWPCKDHPTDKADSVDVVVTCDSTLKVGSEGRLVSRVSNSDGTATTHWAERYPIATYLVSIAITDYAEFTDWFVYSPTDSMPVLNYVLPERLEQAKTQLPLTIGMLQIFSDAFGLYPFIREKYGHSEFGWGGGMEHQTMTSISTYSEYVVAHELSHQWFGDKITCGSWHDIWLNEGFATFCEALYAQRKYYQSTYRLLIDADMKTARLATVSVLGVDTADVRILFNPYSTYKKGGVVLHMLRHVIGDSAFFRGMRSYASDPRFAYKTAVTADFRGVMESVSGKNLGYFFDEWLQRVGFPTYAMSVTTDSAAGGFGTRVTINQLGTPSNPVYTMPIDLKISFASHDSIVTVWNDSASQTYTFHLTERPKSVTFDPDNWILKGENSTTSVAAPGSKPMAYHLEQNFPQPFNPSTTIRFGIGARGPVTVKVYTVVGQEIATLVNDVRDAGDYSVQWDAGSLPSGVYFCRMESAGYQAARKLVLIK